MEFWFIASIKNPGSAEFFMLAFLIFLLVLKELAGVYIKTHYRRLYHVLWMSIVLLFGVFIWIFIQEVQRIGG